MKAILIRTFALLFAITVLNATAFAESPNLRLGAPSLPRVSRSAEETERYEQFQSFLKDTGFPDLSEKIAATLNSPSASQLEELNRQTLQANWHRLQIVNFARDLSAELMTAFTPMLGNEEGAKKVAELAARFISQKRLSLPDAFPDAIRNIRNFDQRAAAKEQYLHSAIEKNIIRMQEQMLSDSIHTIYGRENIDRVLNGSDPDAKKRMEVYIKRLDTMIYRYVRALYFDHEMGLGRWLGEGLALSLVHTSRLSQDPEVRKFEQLLAARAYAHGEHLSDYVSDTLTFEDSKGGVQTVRVKTGDTITELYSLAWPSRMSAAGVRPHILNRYKAMKEGLSQDFVYAAVTADEMTATWKAADGKEPSFVDKIRQVMAAREAGKVGASHAGMAYVYRNKKSGVALVRAIDMYAFGPLPYGGARFISAKSIFATPGVFANFGVASLDPVKILRYLQKVIKEKGYQRVFKVTEVYRLDQNGKLVKSEGELYEWVTRISEEQQRAILSVPIAEAQRWYDEFLSTNLGDEFLRFITDYGTAFRTYSKDPANKASCYCTEAVNVVGFRETGVNLQSHPDSILLLGKVVRLVYPKIDEKTTMFKERPIGPNFMAWDPKTHVKTIRYSLRGPLESWMEEMQTPRNDFDYELTARLSRYLNRKIRYSQKEIGQSRYPLENYLNSVEVAVVPDPKNPTKSVAEPRNHPMGVATSEAAKQTYNPAPPSNPKTSFQTIEDVRTRQNLLATIIQATRYPYSSPAAGYILGEMKERLGNPETLKLMLAFTAKMMALKPVNPPRMLPPEVQSLPPNERAAGLEDYVFSYTAKLVETQTRQILSDVAGLMYGKSNVARAIKQPTQQADLELRQKLKDLYTLIGTEVRKIYFDRKIADARVLGATLALGLINARLKDGTIQELTPLADNLKTYGLQWQDFFEFELNSPVQESIKIGDLKTLRTRLNPGEIQRNRLSAPVNKQAPRATELAQLRYSPYAEVDAPMTRMLDDMLNRDPQFSRPDFNQAERQTLVNNSIMEYLVPLNREQIGVSNPYSSVFLRANPTAPKAPEYTKPAPESQRSRALTCRDLLAG